MPIWNDIDKCLNVSLANRVAESASRRLALKNVTTVPRRDVVILALHTPIFDFCGSTSVKSSVHSRTA